MKAIGWIVRKYTLPGTCLLVALLSSACVMKVPSPAIPTPSFEDMQHVTPDAGASASDGEVEQASTEQRIEYTVQEYSVYPLVLIPTMWRRPLTASSGTHHNTRVN
jgi:hypothetical protein